MRSCDVCLEPTVSSLRDADGDLVCVNCHDAIAYWRALTPEAFRAELAAIQAHTQAVVR